MPRYLYLLRHAQSADKQTGQTDKERVLTATGKAESNAVGNFLKENALIPDLILASSAVRAKTTTEIVTRVFNYPSSKIIFEDDLYEATIPHFIELVSRLESEIDKAMIVGHNPVISYLINHLTKEQTSGLHPAELVILELKISNWTDAHNVKAEVKERFHPIVDSTAI